MSHMTNTVRQCMVGEWDVTRCNPFRPHPFQQMSKINDDIYVGYPSDSVRIYSGCYFHTFIITTTFYGFYGLIRARERISYNSKIHVDIHYNVVSLGTGSLCDAQEEHHPPRQVARFLRQIGHRDPDRLPRTPPDCASILQPPHRHGPQNDRLGSAAATASCHRRQCSRLAEGRCFSRASGSRGGPIIGSRLRPAAAAAAPSIGRVCAQHQPRRRQASVASATSISRGGDQHRPRGGGISIGFGGNRQ